MKALSQGQVNKITNAQLKEALGTLNANNDDNAAQPFNTVLLDEIISLRDELTQVTNMKLEVEQLTSKL